MRHSDNILENILGQKTKIKILRYLALHGDEFSGRHIAKFVGVSPWQCHKVMDELYREGVLNMRRVGNTHLYSIRRKNYLVEKAILPLFKAESDITQRLAADLLRIMGKNIVSLIMYGSVSRQTARPRSDIDIAAVTRKKDPELASKIMKHNDFFLDRYGNSLAPYIVSKEDFRKRHKNGDALIANIVADGIVLAGKTIGELLR